MKNMKRFVAWIALLAILLSSFAFAEEMIPAEAAVPEELSVEAQLETGSDEAAEIVEAEMAAFIEEATEVVSDEYGIATAAYCYHMWKRYEDNGDGTHTAYCSQCSQFMFTEEHEFYSSFCVDCKLQNGECEHLGTYAMDQGNGKHKFFCSYCNEDLGREEAHWEYCSTSWDECWECRAKGEWAPKHDFNYVHVDGEHGSHRLECTAWGCWEKDESTLAPHTYDENGVCSVCSFDASSCRYCYSHCDMPNVCVDCGRECEEVSHGTVSTVKYNEYFHADICNLCGEITYLSKHYVVCALGGKTCSEKYGCGAKVDPKYVDVEHVADGYGTLIDPSNPDYHYYTCRHCKKKISELHNVSCDAGDKFCYTCQTSVEAGKRHYSVDTSAKPVLYPSDASKHGWACSCGEVLYPVAHTYKDGVCTACGAEKQGVRSVAFQSDAAKLLAGESFQSVLVIDGMYSKISYKSSGTAVAAVDANGLVTAKKAGSATITATVTGVDGETMSAKLSVTVQAVPSKITLSAKSLTLGVGESNAVKATLAPKGAYDVLNWSSSDEAVATVDADGNITAAGEGKAVITAETVNGKTASVTVTVLGAPAVLNVDVSELMLNPKKAYSLKVEVTSAAGGKCAGSPVFESSDPAVAAVDAKGKITAKAAGAAVISVSTYNGLVHQVQVSVFNLPKKVTLNTAAENLNMGDTLQLTASVAADEYTTFSWTSSNKKVAAVDANGFVTTLGEGKANITVKTANGKSAVCKLTVVDPFKPSGIELAQSGTVELALGSTLELNASLLPASAKSELKWTSSNKKIADVDANGLVTPVKEGTITITVATYNNKKAAVKVKVIDPKKCMGVELAQSGTVTVTAGETLQLEANLLPVTAETTLTWTSSSKKVADVDENGLVTAVSAGTATITVKTANGKKDTVKIKVEKAPAPSGIELEGGVAALNLLPGDTCKLQPVLQPAGAFSILSWESANPDVATVEDGLVTAVSEGETTVTVTTENGLSASCEVEVVGNEPTQLTLNASFVELWAGMTFRLVPAVDRGETSFTYQSFDTNVVAVDGNGVLSVVSPGEATVRVSAENGVWADCKILTHEATKAIYIHSSAPAMLAVGQTFQLEAEAQWFAPISYASTDEKVITVDENGLITVVGAGKAQVILSVYNGVTAAYDVTAAMPPEVLTEEMDAELHAELQADIDAILNAKTEIVHSDTYVAGETYTGRAFYVSADGDDNNDGLTPETAWRTIGKVNKEAGWDENGAVQAGDAVFFRRGDTFRLTEENGGTMIPTRDGVTFSAYGEGEKPIITYSSENGSGAEKWELAYEDASGTKIWKYYRDMNDTSMIVCNDGEAITGRVYEWWDGDGYVSCTNEADDFLMDGGTDGVQLLDRLLSLEETLTEDMTIVSRPERGEGFECYEGPVYFRCDAGNPGEIYESLEFTEYNLLGNVWLSASDTVFDNISFRSGGRAFFGNGGTATSVQNTIVQNCEFAYGGGTVSKYDTSNGYSFLAVHGDGIYTIVNNATYRNNYFHDMPSCAISYEYNLESAESPRGFWQVLDNVMVNTFGLRLDSTPEALKDLSSVIIRGNQIWNTGSTDLSTYYYAEGSIFYMPNRYGEAIIEDNVFYTSENNHPTNALLNLVFYDHEFFTGYTKPVLQNNTYVQNAGGKFVDFMMQMGESWKIDEDNVVAKAVELLGDLFSRFFIKK